MQGSLSSRERMLMTMDCQQPDYVPLSFMIFSTLRDKCKDEYDFVEKQLALGLDAVVDCHGLPHRFDSQVAVKEWQEPTEKGDHFLLCREYQTPAGILRTTVHRTTDWPHGVHIPLFDDYLIPRSREFLVKDQADLKALQHLFATPTKDDICAYRERVNAIKRFAEDRALLTSGGWGVGMDAACWLCGIEPLMFAAVENTEFVTELAALIGQWNQSRMEVVLDSGIDLYIRRGWYECADFWSPEGFRKYIQPSLEKEVRLAHQAGARFGYILTTGTMPLLDNLLECGIDVLIGVDPVQGRGTDLRELKHRVAGRMCLWGGINSFITVERGSAADVEEAVELAIHALSPGGGLILSPVDNVMNETERTWANVQTLIETWKRLRTWTPLPE